MLKVCMSEPREAICRTGHRQRPEEGDLLQIQFRHRFQLLHLALSTNAAGG